MDTKGATGLVLVVGGLVQLVGSLTGNEASMLAALFEPSLLQTKQGSSAIGSKTSITNGIEGAISGVIGRLGIS